MTSISIILIVFIFIGCILFDPPPEVRDVDVDAGISGLGAAVAEAHHAAKLVVASHRPAAVGLTSVCRTLEQVAQWRASL